MSLLLGWAYQGQTRVWSAGMDVLQVYRVRVLIWLLQLLQEGCFCWESHHQYPEHRSPERQAGTTSHHLAVVGMSVVRETQLSRDVTVQDRDLVLWGHGTRKSRETQNLRAQQKPTVHSNSSKCSLGFSFPPFKGRNRY